MPYMLFCDLLLFPDINKDFSRTGPPTGHGNITHHPRGQGFIKLHIVVPICPIHH